MAVVVEQAAPVHPGSHRHAPLTHTPLVVQSDGHAREGHTLEGGGHGPSIPVSDLSSEERDQHAAAG